MKIPAKFFPFAARQPLWDMAKKHGKMKYSIVAIWDYMFWRSGKGGLFELAEELVCLDLGCDPTTIRAVRRILVAEGWLRKEVKRDKGGKWEVRGWTVIANITATVPKAIGGEVEPPSREPAVVESTVDTTSGGKSPHTVSYTLCNPTSSSTPSASTPSGLASKQVSKQADSVAAPDSQTLEAKNKAFEERYGSEYESQGGNRADFNTRLALVTQNLHEPFGMSYITVNNVEAICRIAYASLFREMTDSEILKLPVYARTHSFWKKRTPTYSALANNMANGDETGLIAQFRSAQALLGKVSHKPLSNVEVAAIKGVGFTKEEVEYERTHDGNGNLIAVGTGFDVEEAE